MYSVQLEQIAQCLVDYDTSEWFFIECCFVRELDKNNDLLLKENIKICKKNAF